MKDVSIICRIVLKPAVLLFWRNKKKVITQRQKLNMKIIPYVLIWNIFIGSTLLFLTNIVIAQEPCNDEGVMNTKGSWKKNPDANVFPDPAFPKSQLPQVTSRIDNMQKLLQAAYPEPKGMEAGWYRSITGNPTVKAGPVPYALNSLFIAYFCNTYEKKIEPGGETGTWFYVWTNQLNNWFAEYIKYYVIQKQPVYLLQKKIGEVRGYPLFEGNYNQTSNTGTRYSRAIILTRTGQSPYLPVTQKQFLKAFLNYNEKRIPKFLADLENNTKILTDEEEEANKKKNLEIIERVTASDKVAKAKENFLKNYVTSRQKKEASIAQTKMFYENELKPARDLLADSLKQELGQPAILDFDNLLTFKEFSTEEKGGRQLVRLNPGYFDIAQPKYIPQLFIVYWSWDDTKPANYWRTEIEKNFNFNALKEMIDK